MLTCLRPRTRLGDKMNNSNDLASMRTLGELPLEERPLILEDYLDMGSKNVRQKYHISSHVLAQMVYLYKGELQELEDEHFARFGL